eukprot:4018866-Alexandrium_andersonii.AAC.1
MPEGLEGAARAIFADTGGVVSFRVACELRTIRALEQKLRSDIAAVSGPVGCIQVGIRRAAGVPFAGFATE